MKKQRKEKLILFTIYIVLITLFILLFSDKTSVQAQEIDASLRIEANQEIIVIIPPHTSTIKTYEEWETLNASKSSVTCDLSFQSNNDGIVEPNALTLSQIANVSDCRDRQVLVRLAHYESTQADICNSLGYCGEFQIGKLAWIDCKKSGISKDAECALYHFNIDAYNRFESVSRNYNSFEEFIK